MSVEINPPFRVFTDVDGEPLEDGYIFIGAVNQNPQAVPVSVYWDEALTIPAAQPIRTLGGYPSRSGTPSRMYVAGSYSIAVSNKNSTLIYSDLNNIAGDAALRQDLADDTDPLLGPGLLGFDEDLDYALGTVGNKLLSITRKSLRAFGVIGDGVADDSDALEGAILSGEALDWGSLTIRVTRTIGDAALIPAAINWHSNGAQVLLDAPGITSGVLYFEVLPLHHQITGRLFIDGNLQAFSGLYLRNNSALGFPAGFGWLYAEGVQVENIRRADATYPSGDGIIVRGAWHRVILDRPHVRNVLLAAGAGTPGVVGVSGITVFGNDVDHYPRTLVVIDPYIENISSEDPAYTVDMDGIRAFGPVPSSPTVAVDSTFSVRGGTFRNCWGRSIKSQMTTGRVAGSKFIRTTGNNTGVGGNEVDFQLGAGFASDLECFYYSGNLPFTVVNLGQGTFEHPRPAGKVDGINVYSNSGVLTSVVQTFAPAIDAGVVSVNNIQVVGSVVRVIEYLVNDDENILSVSNITVDSVTSELIRAQTSGAASPFGAKIQVQNCINTGAVIPLLRHNVAGNAVITELTEYACEGFTRGNSAVLAVNNPGSIMRPYAMGGAGQSVGGTMRVQALSVPAGATVQFEAHGGVAGIYAAVLSINFNQTATAFFGVSGGGTASISSGAGVVVGTTGDPGSGTFRVWATAGGVVNVRNTDVATRVATLFCMG